MIKYLLPRVLHKFLTHTLSPFPSVDSISLILEQASKHTTFFNFRKFSNMTCWICNLHHLQASELTKWTTQVHQCAESEKSGNRREARQLALADVSQSQTCTRISKSAGWIPREELMVQLKSEGSLEAEFPLLQGTLVCLFFLLTV